MWILHSCFLCIASCCARVLSLLDVYTLWFVQGWVLILGLSWDHAWISYCVDVDQAVCSQGSWYCTVATNWHDLPFTCNLCCLSNVNYFDFPWIYFSFSHNTHGWQDTGGAELRSVYFFRQILRQKRKCFSFVKVRKEHFFFSSTGNLW